MHRCWVRLTLLGALWNVGHDSIAETRVRPTMVRRLAEPAQQDNEEPREEKSSDKKPPDDTTTLPPVIVRPPQPAPPAAQPPAVDVPSGPGDLPLTQPAPTAPSAPGTGVGAGGGEGVLPEPSDFDRPLSYPGLGQQVFGGSGFGSLDSAIRGDLSLFDLPSLGTILDRGTLDQKLAPDLYHALQNEAGVLVQQTGRGQASPFLRGLTGQQVLILVDGVRVNNTIQRAGPNQYFNTIDIGQVERIEVIRGSQSVLWGSDALGGVINIVTRNADPNRGTYRGGSFTQYFSTADQASYSRANVEGWVAESGIFAGGSFFDVHDLDRGGGMGRQPFTSYDQYAGDIKYNVMLTEEQLVTFAFSHFVQRNVPRSDRFLPFVLGPPANTPRPTFFDPQQRDLAYVRWQGVPLSVNPFLDRFSVTTSYSLTREGQNELRSPTQLDQGKFSDDMVGFQMVLSKDADEFGTLTYGADYYYEDVDANRFRVNPQDPTQAPTDRPPQYPDDAVADRAGAFVNWDLLLTDRWNINAGVRYENANIQATPEFTINGTPQDISFDRTYQDWIGSVGMTYELCDRVHAVGGVYEGYRAPTLDDLTANTTFQQNAQANPTLGSLGVQPETTRTYEVGIKRDGDRLRLQVFQWWMTIDDYIARSVDGAGNVFLGNHEAYLYGNELVGEYLLPAGWGVYGNFSYTFGRDDTTSEPFSRIPPAQGIAGLRWQSDERLRYFDFYTWLVHRQDRYNSVNLTDSRFPVGGQPGYGTLNLRAGTSLGDADQHRLSLVLENLTDRFYRVLGSGVDGPGFNAIFGYELHR